MAGTAPGLASDAGSNEWSKIWKAAVGIVGTTGIAAAVGYISLFAAQEFLGIPQKAESATELSFAAADFAMNTFLLAGAQLAAHPVLAAILIGLITLTALKHEIDLQLRHKIRWKKQWRILKLCTAALSAVIAIFILFWFDVPETQLRDVLIVGVQPGISTNSSVGRRTVKLWDALKASRNAPQSTRTGSIAEFSFDDNNPGVSYLRQQYVTNLALLLFAWLLLTQSHVGEISWVGWKLLRTISLSLLLIGTLFIPYVHGKIIRSTAMRQISVHLKKDKKWQNGYLLAESDRGVTVLLPKDGTLTVEVISKENFDMFNLDEPADALAEKLRMPGVKPPKK